MECFVASVGRGVEETYERLVCISVKRLWPCLMENKWRAFDRALEPFVSVIESGNRLPSAARICEFSFCDRSCWPPSLCSSVAMVVPFVELLSTITAVRRHFHCAGARGSSPHFSLAGFRLKVPTLLRFFSSPVNSIDIELVHCARKLIGIGLEADAERLIAELHFDTVHVLGVSASELLGAAAHPNLASVVPSAAFNESCKVWRRCGEIGQNVEG